MKDPSPGDDLLMDMRIQEFEASILLHGDSMLPWGDCPFVVLDSCCSRTSSLSLKAGAARLALLATARRLTLDRTLDRVRAAGSSMGALAIGARVRKGFITR